MSGNEGGFVGIQSVIEVEQEFFDFECEKRYVI